MFNPRHFFSLGLLLAGIAQAGELAIEAKPFEIAHQLNARVMPVGEVPLVQIDSKAWQSFPITALAEHGSTVKKGDVLVSFDARAIDKRIEGLKRQIISSELTIAETKDKLAQLEETAASRLEAAKREAAESKERLDYFTKSGRKAEEEEALYEIERSEQWLQNEKEELRQLKAMYEADDLTEDTEEIILVRQQNAVKRAELGLRLSKLRNTREVEVMLPRKAVALAKAAEDAAVALKYAERQIPREIEQTKTQLEGLEKSFEKDRTELADLEHDRGFFEIVAEADGIFYHGAIADGEWTTGDLLRGLRVGGSAPLHTAFASLVPKEAKLELVAHTDDAKTRELAGAEGIATLAGTEALGAEISAIPCRLSKQSLVPSTKGQYQLSFTPQWPAKLDPKVGNSATLQLLSYSKENAIVIPAKALKYGLKGWSVEVKLADGKTERRSVTRGPQSGDEVEILSGLEVGQVIITP